VFFDRYNGVFFYVFIWNSHDKKIRFAALVFCGVLLLTGLAVAQSSSVPG
jgi:hypothetical protein